MYSLGFSPLKSVQISPHGNSSLDSKVLLSPTVVNTVIEHRDQSTPIGHLKKWLT